jgi:hypothetical protein
VIILVSTCLEYGKIFLFLFFSCEIELIPMRFLWNSCVDTSAQDSIIWSSIPLHWLYYWLYYGCCIIVLLWHVHNKAYLRYAYSFICNTMINYFSMEIQIILAEIELHTTNQNHQLTEGQYDSMSSMCFT